MLWFGSITVAKKIKNRADARNIKTCFLSQLAYCASNIRLITLDQSTRSRPPTAK